MKHDRIFVVDRKVLHSRTT